MDKPAAVQECEMGECQPQWFTTEWSAVRGQGNDWKGKCCKLLQCIFHKFIKTLPAFGPQCSRSCGKGLQMREARCLTKDKKHRQDCDLSTKPAQEQTCNTIPCGPQVSGRCAYDMRQYFNMFLSFISLPTSLSSVHRWKLPGQTSQLRDGGSGQALRLLVLQECLLCLVYPECSAHQEALTSTWSQPQTA